MGARTQSEVERWRQKLEGLKTTKEEPEEIKSLEAIFPYEARRDDELSFDVGDLIRVTQIQPDGWYFGEKTNPTTGESGWFPGLNQNNLTI